MTVFYTVIGDAPEAIFACDLDVKGDWTTWRARDPREALRPELPYEGADCPRRPSERGAIDRHVNQLRDPDVFVDTDGTAYLLYAVAGENGIAVAKLA